MTRILAVADCIRARPSGVLVIVAAVTGLSWSLRSARPIRNLRGQTSSSQRLQANAPEPAEARRASTSHRRGVPL